MEESLLTIPDLSFIFGMLARLGLTFSIKSNNFTGLSGFFQVNPWPGWLEICPGVCWQFTATGVIPMRGQMSSTGFRRAGWSLERNQFLTSGEQGTRPAAQLSWWRV